jgi:molybdopterin molybdotransferase
MIPVSTAETLVLEATPTLGTEWVSADRARDRILAETIASPEDFPAADTSSMDGYAVCHQDVVIVPCELDVVETLPAGTLSQQSLQPGQAARLYTGSVLPVSADTVVIQEVTERLSESKVRILSSAEKGQFVRSQGHFCRQGDPVLLQGQRLGAAELAVLAAVRRFYLPVYRRPRVAILSTGDELVAPDRVPGSGQIVDSNQPGLAALVAAAGGIPLCLGILQDTTAAGVSGGKALLHQTIASALRNADMILSSGGVSVGDYDYVESVLSELGATLHFNKVAIKPGKPFTFATFDQHGSAGNPVIYCGLPGNPVSAMVCFWRFVKPALQKLQGQLPPWSPPLLTAIAAAELSGGGQREAYLWGRAQVMDGEIVFVPASELGSGNLINLAGTNALAVVPIGQTAIVAGAPVSVLLTQPF